MPAAFIIYAFMQLYMLLQDAGMSPRWIVEAMGPLARGLLGRVMSGTL